MTEPAPRQHLVHFCHPQGARLGPCIEVSVEQGADGRYTIVGPASLSDSQREQVMRQLEEMRKRRAREALAEERSKELLTRLLTDDQRACFEKHGHIEVIGASGANYRIVCGTTYSGNVLAIDKGKPRGSYCIYPNYRCPPDCRDHMPRHDAFLGQLLLLTTDEQEFRRIAYFTHR